MFAAAHHMCNSVLAGGMAVEAWVDCYFIYETQVIFDRHGSFSLCDLITTQVIFRPPWPAVGLGGYVSSFNAAG